MDAAQQAGMLPSQNGRNETAPIAALRAEALVTEDLGHQLRERIGDVFDAEALLPGLEGERVAGKRRRHHGEVLGEERDDRVEFDDRARPAVRKEERHGVRSPARIVDKMKIDAADRQDEQKKKIKKRI